MYRIRRARASELERVQAIDRELLDGSRPDYKYKSTVWWVAVVPGREITPGAADEIVGYAAGYLWAQDEERAFVMTRCGVVKEHRGRGLQHRLLRARIRHARALGARAVWTYTHATNIKSSNNLIAEGFRLWKPNHWAGERVRGTAWLHWERRL